VMKTLMRNGRDRRSENPVFGSCEERTREFVWDRLADRIRVRRPHSKAEYMTAAERFADSQIPLAPRAPSIHDPNRTFLRSQLMYSTLNRSSLPSIIAEGVVQARHLR
jgi:hypothetical protein